MTWMDRWIQRQRLNQAMRHIPPGVHVLDIGCHRGELFQAMGNRLGKGFGMDPLMPKNLEKQRFTLIKGNFPADWMMKTKMNCVTLLAVLEHIPTDQQAATAKIIFDLLIPGGLVILTVPSKKTDGLLTVLHRLGIIRGMCLEEHYGFDPADTKPLFEEAGFTLMKHRTFQFGLNNLFVFERKG